MSAAKALESLYIIHRPTFAFGLSLMAHALPILVIYKYDLTCIHCYAKLSQRKPAHEVALSPFKTCNMMLQYLLGLSAHFGLRLYLRSFDLCASSEGSGETASISRLV